MVDRTLFPHPPRSAILAPSSVSEVEPVVRAFWHEHFQGDPALVDSFWSVVPGTKGYCAALEYTSRNSWSPVNGMPRWDWGEHGDLQKRLGRYFLGRRNYGLVFLDEHPGRINAYEFHDFGDSGFLPYEKLRKIEPGIPADPWDFAESRGVVIERWPEPEPPPPVYVACVIEDATPTELKPLCKRLEVLIHPHSRGVLLTGKQAGYIGIEVACKLDKSVYLLQVFPTINEFMCTVFEDGGTKEGQFVSPPGYTQYPRLDSVLGETTPHGILRALEVPPGLVGLAPDPSA